jgi:hypothetical protein
MEEAMKSIPLKSFCGNLVQCEPDEATHLKIRIPGPTGELSIPVMIKGDRAGTGNWTWNGSVETPTLKPSLLTQGHNFRCHCFVNDGKVQFLMDCTHEHIGKIMDLLEFEKTWTPQETWMGGEGGDL